MGARGAPRAPRGWSTMAVCCCRAPVSGPGPRAGFSCYPVFSRERPGGGLLPFSQFLPQETSALDR